MADEYVKQCPTCGESITAMEVSMVGGTITMQCGHMVPVNQYTVHVEKDLVGRKVGQWLIHHDLVVSPNARLFVAATANLGDMWDYTSRPMSYATMKQKGCRAISRYLSPSSYGAWKNLTASEADEIRANGFDLRSNWEGYADFRNDPRYPGDPYGMGRLDGAQAYQMHRNCGGTDWAGIVFSFDVPDLDGPTCERYLLGVYSLGLPFLPDEYGKHEVLDYLRTSVLLSKAHANLLRHAPWMTSSWNYNTGVAQGAALHQYYYANAYDASYILNDYYGGWSQAVNPTVQQQQETGDEDVIMVQVDKNTVPQGAQWPGYFLLTGDGQLIHIPPAQPKTNNPKDTSSNIVGLENAGIKDGGWITYDFYKQLTSNQTVSVRAAAEAWNPPEDSADDQGDDKAPKKTVTRKTGAKA